MQIIWHILYQIYQYNCSLKFDIRFVYIKQMTSYVFLILTFYRNMLHVTMYMKLLQGVL